MQVQKTSGLFDMPGQASCAGLLQIHDDAAWV